VVWVWNDDHEHVGLVLDYWMGLTCCSVSDEQADELSDMMAKVRVVDQKERVLIVRADVPEPSGRDCGSGAAFRDTGASNGRRFWECSAAVSRGTGRD